MPINFTMPALSPTMKVGKISLWKKKEGDSVSPGDVVVEIETDKATMEVEAVDDAFIGKIIVPEGTDNVPVNSVLAILLEEGEEISSIDFSALNIAPNNTDDHSSATMVNNQTFDNNNYMDSNNSVPEKINLDYQTDSSRTIASPLARKLAKELAVNISELKGTGPGGRIIKSDVLNRNSDSSPVNQSQATQNKEQDLIIPNSMMRTIIASRLSDSWKNIPHIFLSIDCCIDNLLDVRKRLNDKRNKEDHLSINDFIIRASAFALKELPEINSQWRDESIIKLHDIDISIAVSMEGGLVTPIIKNADQKGLSEISKELKELANRGRKGTLLKEEYEGGSFSISNLGMLGVDEFSAIINPPQSAILAVGVAKKRPVVKNDAISISTIMKCTLSCDHRVIDGSVAAKWLSIFKDFVEEPMATIL